MLSFQLSVTPSERVGANFVAEVRIELLKAIHDSGVSKSDIARAVGVHRSVITRQLGGYQDISLKRVGEIAGAIDCEIEFKLLPAPIHFGGNAHPMPPAITTVGRPINDAFATATIAASPAEGFRGTISTLHTPIP